MNGSYATLNTRRPLVFDGTKAVCFIMTLMNNVPAGRTKNIAPGVLYTFIIHQNAAKSYTFAWPITCLNAIPVDQTPDSTTVQNFIGLTGGTLQADPPGTWTQKEQP
jgi:hypothetical protein